MPPVDALPDPVDAAEDAAETGLATVTHLPNVELAHFDEDESHPDLGAFVRAIRATHARLISRNVQLVQGTRAPLPIALIPYVEYSPGLRILAPEKDLWARYRMGLEAYKARRAALVRRGALNTD